MRSQSWGRFVIALALFLFVVGTRFIGSGLASPDRLSVEKEVFQSVEKLYQGAVELKILALTKFPSGSAFEVKKVDGPGYFLVEAETGRVQYASFQQIMTKDKGLKFTFEAAESIARKWVKQNHLLAGYRYEAKQPDFNWPKRGYYTAVWAGQGARKKDIAKVTVDLETGKVASFGVGNPKWSMFCVPNKEIAP